ncbi:MAG: inositol monophosphatase family protein [Phycisphaerales bacterium]|nr:inositol monophosphatase family protein [Phycisphaerales bacterium]
MSTHPSLKEFLLNTIQKAGDIVIDYSIKGFTINNKDGIDNNLVTEADKASEAFIIREIQTAYPDHAILSEEIGILKNTGHIKWIIDPIDGTVNFAHGFPLSTISISLEQNGIQIMGAVYNPFLKELYFAEKGKGAFLNNKKISVSTCNRLESSLIITGFPYIKNKEKLKKNLIIFEQLLTIQVAMRRIGCASMDLCWVASGKADAYYEYSLKPWDVAAGYLILEEAGGTVTNYQGDTYNPYEESIVSSNTIIHHDLLKIIQGVYNQDVYDPPACIIY